MSCENIYLEQERILSYISPPSRETEPINKHDFAQGKLISLLIIFNFYNAHHVKLQGLKNVITKQEFFLSIFRIYLLRMMTEKSTMKENQ